MRTSEKPCLSSTGCSAMGLKAAMLFSGKSELINLSPAHEVDHSTKILHKKSISV
jgi:hypothetical protein